MAHVQHVDRGTYVATDRDADHGMSVIARIVSLVGYIIFALLAFRFVLSLFGANRGNPFADFIYDTSHPLVAPFFGLFNYTPQFGISRFEFETLIAMLFYGIVIGIIVRALTIGRRDTI
jgi:uncharacterized protein YggT (Ycf19 family)